MNATTLLGNYLLPFLLRLSRLGLIGGCLVFAAYFVLAAVPYFWSDLQAQTNTAALARLTAPWMVALWSVYGLGQLSASMVRVWLEDHGGALPRR